MDPITDKIYNQKHFLNFFNLGFFTIPSLSQTKNLYTSSKYALYAYIFFGI